jgi:hypothetical protein
MANPYTVTYYGGQPVVDNIPAAFREYDARTAMLTKIQEGRANLMRLLLEYARRGGAYIARDVESRWGIEYGRLAKIFMSANSTSSSGTLHDILTVTNAEGRRLQPGDILNLMGFWVKYDTTTGRTLAAATGAGIKTRTSTYFLPEQVKVLENYGDDSGTAGYAKIKVRRNFGGTAPTGHVDLLVDVAGWAGSTYAGDIDTTGPFLWKAGNSIPEGRDDQWTYTDVDEYDYNYCQIVMRKWSATETEQNVDRFYTTEKTYQRNARRALEEFYKELDSIATFGTRKTETENGRRKWYTGGILEFIPTGNIIGYGDTLFQTANFNTQLKDMFYYGSQTKLVLAGASFYTKFSNMIDNKIILPAAVNGWGVELQQFRTTNGGTLLFAPSDTLSLHGMSDYAIVIDPESFKYGHLQNMDIKAIQVETVNPHEQEGEIYGQIIFKRTNPKANWLFMKTS